MEKVKTKMALWKKLLIVFLALLLVVCLAFGGFVAYFRLPVQDYYNASEKAFVIPDLNVGVIPQGFDYDKNNDYFLMSAYMKDDSPSRLYLIDNATGKVVKKVTFKTDKGKIFDGHFGGVALYSDFLYVANGKSLLVYSYSDILKATDGGVIDCLGKVSTSKSDEDYCKVSFVTVSDDTLYVGEYYSDKGYDTLDSHRFETSTGEYNSAIALEFKLSESYPLGIDATPKKAYSLPNKVQGMYVTSGKIYLSTSYGLSFSHILEYDKNKLNSEKSTKVLDTEVSVLVLDESCLANDYKLPPMSEEIVVLDNELYVMNESASTKYIFGKFTGGKWCYKTDLTKLA
ncbi:MAG: hypothetical protein IJW64_02260 [Clostridia bacterium]|nr:hypothetical protein [Clostridia bacterium]